MKMFRNRGNQFNGEMWFPNLFSVIVNRYLKRLRDKNEKCPDFMEPVFEKARNTEDRFRRMFKYEGK